MRTWYVVMAALLVMACPLMAGETDAAAGTDDATVTTTEETTQETTEETTQETTEETTVATGEDVAPPAPVDAHRFHGRLAGGRVLRFVGVAQNGEAWELCAINVAGPLGSAFSGGQAAVTTAARPEPRGSLRIGDQIYVLADVKTTSGDVAAATTPTGDKLGPAAAVRRALISSLTATIYPMPDRKALEGTSDESSTATTTAAPAALGQLTLAISDKPFGPATVHGGKGDATLESATWSLLGRVYFNPQRQFVRKLHDRIKHERLEPAEDAEEGDEAVEPREPREPRTTTDKVKRERPVRPDKGMKGGKPSGVDGGF